MRRVLLTWDSHGTWIPDNVKESHKDAARRWNVEYVCIEKLTCSPFADKALLLHRAEGDQVVWIDGDAIIRFDCPSLFDIVSQDTFAGVPNFQDDTHAGDPWKYHEPAWLWCLQQYPDRFDLCYDPKTYINGGVIVFCPKLHRDIWAVDYPIAPMAEQTLMNFRADMLGVKRMSLSLGFNRIGPQAWQPGPMSRFIQHLAAFSWGDFSCRRHERRAALEAIDWTQAAPVEQEALCASS